MKTKKEIEEKIKELKRKMISAPSDLKETALNAKLTHYIHALEWVFKKGE